MCYWYRCRSLLHLFNKQIRVYSNCAKWQLTERCQLINEAKATIFRICQPLHFTIRRVIFHPRSHLTLKIFLYVSQFWHSNVLTRRLRQHIGIHTHIHTHTHTHPLNRYQFKFLNHQISVSLGTSLASLRDKMEKGGVKGVEMWPCI